VEQTTLLSLGNVDFPSLQVILCPVSCGRVQYQGRCSSSCLLVPSLLLCRSCSVKVRSNQLHPRSFLLVIILVAHFSGRLASLLAAILGGLVFAGFLFRPYGRFAVCNAADRVVLLLIRRVRPRRGLPFQDPGKLNRHEPLTHAMLSLPKKRLARGGRIQALPLREAFPIARRPPSKPTASTHPG
jgi:hypothetical protein